MLDEMYPPQRSLSGRSEDGPDDEEIGRQWRENSSLEKWFPLTAERLAALEAENATLKREAHTWSKAAEHYAKPLQPLDPLDVEELWDVANADPYADEVHHEFARLLQRKLGIGA
jgi:hypothetical protein